MRDFAPPRSVPWFLGARSGALRRVPAVPRVRQHAFRTCVEAIPGAGALLLGPEVDEALEQQLAAGLQVHQQDLQSSIGGAMGRTRSQSRIQVPRLTRSDANRRCVGISKVREMSLDSRQHHVAVMEITEDSLQVAGALTSDVGTPPEAEAGHLEHVAQPLRRDPHVVLLLDLPGFERLGRERPHLIEPHPDDPGGVLPQGPLWVELLDPASLHSPGASTFASARLTSSDRRSLSAARRRAPTNPSRRALASACSALIRSTRPAIPGRSGAARPSANLSSASIATSASRRSPSASATSFTSRRTCLCSRFGKHGAKTSSAARRRRVATRISWTRSMSSVSSTSCE